MMTISAEVPKTGASYVLVLRCPERKGIVASVANFLASRDFTIDASNQYHDAATNSFFMRVLFRAEAAECPSLEEIEEEFQELAQGWSMNWEMHSRAVRPRLLLAVSRFGHCLTDLLHRWRSGLIFADIPAVVSNHEDLRSFVEWSGIPFYHLPVSPGARSDQEALVKELVDELDIDLVVLARYMQILSPDLCGFLAGRCINIHHSFLPSFKGAKPYHQAHARGVKMIGATAHYVTTDLDEGPIIAQDTRHVDHGFSPAQLIALGQEVECAVLARAVAAHIEHRVVLNGSKTIVFPS